MNKYAGVHYLRGFAAVLIVIYHSMLMTAVAPYFSHPIGEFGVDIFFVISGFVMWISTESREGTPFTFLTSRLARVAPLYWLITLSIVLASTILPTLFFQSRGIDPIFIAKSLLFIPTRNPDLGDITPFYTIGWTLVYEMYFYCLFGACLFLKKSAARISFFTTLILSLTIFGKLWPSENPIYFTYTNPLLLEFLAGVLLGFHRTKLSRMNPTTSAALLIASMTTLFMVEADQATRAAIYGPPALILVLSAVALESSIRRHQLRLPNLLGEVSYSLYLSHPISQRLWYVAFIFLFGPILSITGAVIYAIGAVLTGIIGGIACYFLAEKALSKLTASILRLAYSSKSSNTDLLKS